MPIRAQASGRATVRGSAVDLSSLDYAKSYGVFRQPVLGRNVVTTSQPLAAQAGLAPHRVENTLAFMWESRWVFRPTKQALQSPQLQKGYDSVWDGFKKLYK